MVPTFRRLRPVETACTGDGAAPAEGVVPTVPRCRTGCAELLQRLHASDPVQTHAHGLSIVRPRNQVFLTVRGFNVDRSQCLGMQITVFSPRETHSGSMQYSYLERVMAVARNGVVVSIVAV